LEEIKSVILSKAEMPAGAVPVYQSSAYSFRRRDVAYFTKKGLFKTIEAYLQDGVDFMTLHMAVTRELAIKALKSERVIPR